jgi:hypothetical protein
MHLGAIDATALLEDHHQALAFFPRGLDVFGNIPERQANQSCLCRPSSPTSADQAWTERPQGRPLQLSLV